MITGLMIFQAVVSVLLIVLVLIQFGKGAEAGLFSGGGDMNMGPGKGNILHTITIVLSVLFLGNSVLLARVQGQKSSSSLLDGETPAVIKLNQDEKAPGVVKEEKPAGDIQKPVDVSEKPKEAAPQANP